MIITICPSFANLTRRRERQMSQEFQRDYLIRLRSPLAQLYQRAYNDKSAQSRHGDCPDRS